MTIDDISIGQLREILAIFGSTPVSASPHLGKKCIIRTYASGVHFGALASQVGRQIELLNARRLWRWDVSPHGISLSEVAVYGPIGPRTRVCCVVPEMTILDAIEVIPCSPDAARVIECAETYTP